jgi:hypothetical protein
MVDLKRCAMYLIGRYGAKVAELRASGRAINLYQHEDRAAADIWFQVAALIRRLQAEKPAPGERVQ